MDHYSCFILRINREGMPVNQVRVHHLHKGANLEGLMYRVEKGMILRFLLAPNLHSETVRVFCNHPAKEADPFDRHTYHELEWNCPTGMRSDLTDVYADVCIVCSGSFNYFFTIDESADVNKANGQGYFIVDPTLKVGKDEEITMDCLQVQSVITKLLGPFEEWENRLAVSRETGYNMIHFTPVQELGCSNSAYSIRDQHVFSPVYSTPGKPTHTMDDLGKLVQKMHQQWRVLSLTDIVLNHTSKDSPWILQHPECAYNLKNSPHLRPAYLVDTILRNFSNEVAEGKWEGKGCPAKLENDGHLNAMRHVLHTEVFPKHNLGEFFLCNIDKSMKEFKRGIEENRVAPKEGEVTIKQDPEYRRNESSVDVEAALFHYNIDRTEGPNVFSRTERVDKCCEAVLNHLHHLNRMKEAEVGDIINDAVNNFVSNAWHQFLKPCGPCLGTVTKENPIQHSYFAVPANHEVGVEQAEEMMNREPEKVMAVNGWVMGDDPLRSFIEEGRQVFIRRHLLPWGDSVKLNYGKKPSDCPFLWEHMKKYCEKTAEIFHAVRLDNCHSTPIHVAQYMLDAARKKRPDLYVVAELFTGNEHFDNIFINKLAINSLIREVMAAKNAEEAGAKVHLYGGFPVGSFAQPRVRPLVPTVAHALFFDQTHDNESPVKARSVYDLWPSAGMLCMANCAVGSNRGYDQLVPHHIHVVDEKRLYPSWSRDGEKGVVNLTSGITNGKRALNNLHYEMAIGGYKEVFVDMLTTDVHAMTRHNPLTHQSIIMVVSNAYQHPHDPKREYTFRNLNVQGLVDEVILEGSMRKKEGPEYQKDNQFINGLSDYHLDIREHIPISSSQFCSEIIIDKNQRDITFKNFTPGTVVAIRTSLTDEAREAILELRRGMGQFGYMMRSYSGNTTFDDTWEKSTFRGVVSRLSLGDLNRVMYRVEWEEKDDDFGLNSTYEIPGHGKLTYSGLRGIVSVLGEVRPTNKLGHGVCSNLRNGDWLMDYISNRLKFIKSTTPLGEWFDGMFHHLKKIPRYLIPCYFDAIVTGAYIVLREMALQQFSDFVKDGSTFVQALSLGSIQFCGFVRSAKLPPLSPKLTPRPRVEYNKVTGQEEEAPVSMAAGLPHFAAGVWRCWGRDTFIAMRGMLLITGRFECARCMILGFAGTLRHGLIPNLLFEGKHARFNCRDAVWWWLHAIKAYCCMSPDKDTYKILHDPVSRLFPTDDSEPLEAGECDQPLHDVMQEALARHAIGVSYRERGAGHALDSDMLDKGFDNEIGIQWPQGYVYGGSIYNCGTWMDKMGSSEASGNKGKPATPRNGSAVELVGLSASVVKWLADLNKEGHYPYRGVTVRKSGSSDQEMSFADWHQSLVENFEKDFFISKEPANEPDIDQINKRGIYKDCINAQPLWSNYQLRPNFPVAMVVAPELFNEDHAWTALEMAQKHLMGPLGMKTLDPDDWAYNGYYRLEDESCDPNIAKGFNYHNGPEWLWPMAYFLRAKLQFACKLEKRQPGILKKTVEFVDQVLCNHYQALMQSPWKSLPELTNRNGEDCPHSCLAQAWSDGCILEVLYDLERIETASRPSQLNLQASLATANA